MKTINPKNIMLGFFGLCTIFSISGAVSTSLAWYSYATRASLLFSGTSVFDNGQLQIGFKSANHIDGLSGENSLGMIEEQINGSYYYFAKAGEGLTSDLMNHYLSKRGYASNELIPVTSGSYKNGDNHVLLTAPNSEVRCPNATDNLAPHANYSQITFAFRTFRTNASGNVEYVSNQEIWLTYAQTRASDNSSGNVSKSMRMYISRDVNHYGANNGFIFNPSSKTEGYTKVGGLLNLGYDQYYDFDDNGEIIYGDYSLIQETDDQDNPVVDEHGDPVYKPSGISSNTYAGEDNIYDINDKWDWDYKPNTAANQQYADTFTAAHSPEAKYYDNLDNLDIKTAQYEGVDTIKPNKDGSNVFSNADENNPTSVCVTGGQSVGYIGEFDATIYLEGWDFSVVDEEQHHKFDFQLRFETNRI